MKKLHTNKGFTLAELLIVVAVIAVLVGIAIPTFADQLEKARESTDVSNIREAYSEIIVALSDGTLTKSNDEITLLGSKKAKLTVADASKTVAITGFPFKQEVFDSSDADKSWAIGAPDVAGVKVTGLTAAANTTLTFTFTKETGTSVTTTSHYYLASVVFSAPAGG